MTLVNAMFTVPIWPSVAMTSCTKNNGMIGAPNVMAEKYTKRFVEKERNAGFAFSSARKF